MTTFSQLVDKMVKETRRRDLLPEICDYLNQSIREVHFDPTGGGAIEFSENRKEALLTASTELSYVWEIPNPAIFQSEEAFEYQSIRTRLDERIFASYCPPGRALPGYDFPYYRAGGTFVFMNYGGVGGKIAASFFEYPNRLIYYAEADRPATYDPVNGWEYEESFNTPELQEQARLLTSNWLLIRWDTVLEEALRAKVYKRVSDDPRARTAYSLYTSLRAGLITSEAVTRSYR